MKGKIAILIICLSALCLPVVFMIAGVQTDVIHRTEFTSSTEEVTFTNWLSGAYQVSAQNFINDNIGFFATFIKLHNQLEYSLFNQAHTGSVIAGKEHFLFDKPYLDAQTDDAFIGLQRIKKRVNRLKFVQDSLANHGKFLMICMAANKPTYYKEYLPYPIEADSTNREYFLKEFNKSGINYIDCDDWFLKMKDTLGELLFPKYGIHWSHFSSMLVADSLAHYISLKNDWNLPRLKITKRVYSDKAKFYDNDIANTMNLIWEPHPDSMMYPEIQWVQPKGEPSKKKVLIIGDSFAMSLVEESGFGTDCFSDLRYWYYNQTVRSPGTLKGAIFAGNLPRLVRHENYRDEIANHDAIIFLSNEPNMPPIGWGFLWDVRRVVNDSSYRGGKFGTENLKAQCKIVDNWRKELQAQADKRGIDLDEMIEIYVSDPDYNIEKERLLNF